MNSDVRFLKTFFRKIRNRSDLTFQFAELTLSVYGPYFVTSVVLSLITLALPSMLGIRMEPDINDHIQMSDDILALLGEKKYIFILNFDCFLTTNLI